MSDEPQTIRMKDVRARAKHWARALNLLHYNVTILLVPEFEDNPGAWASMTPSKDYDKATLRIRDELQLEDLDYVLVHELLHLHMHRYDLAARAALDTLSEAAQTAYEDRLRHEEEAVVDRLTHIILALDK